MQFVELPFLLYFLPLTLLLHRIAVSLNRGSVYGSPARVVIFSSTLIFYGFKEPWWLIPFAICIFFDFLWASLLSSSKTPRTRKIWLWCSVSQNLILLGFFKYFDFILENVALFPPLAPGANQLREVVNLSLPPGISFYTFESLSFVIDVYWRRISPPKSPLQFFAFIGMFPRFIAGPIIRYRDMAHQFTDYRGMQWEKGISTFALGFFFKRVIADRFAQWVPLAFANSQLNFGTAWMGTLSYTFQIYFDFYGYSLMAIGLGQILGFEFPVNFRYPYSANSLKDFWRRWHISLSSWLKDYVYVPLGGNQNGTLKTYRNLLLTMIIGGFWHGANWTFIIWGALHGLGLAFERAFSLRMGRVGTFGIVLIAWVFFRADTVSEAVSITSVLFSPGHGLQNFNWAVDRDCLIGCVLGIAYVNFIEGKFLDLRNRIVLYCENQISWGFVLLAFLVPFNFDNSNIPFLYFQF